MACEEKQAAFDAAFKQIQSVLKAEIAAVTLDTQSRTRALSEEFKDNLGAGQAAGAAGGAVAGGALGGAAGAALGAAAGRTIGALFAIDLGEEKVRISLDIPEISVRTTEWSLNLPEVSTKDSDIIFDVPTMVMKTVEGPPVPEVHTEMKLECISVLGKKICTKVPQATVRWKKTYIDVPTWENRKQRVVIGVPSITMRTRKMSMDLPQVTMKPRELSFTVPSVTIRVSGNASQDLAERARDIAADAATLIGQKQAAFKDRMRSELVGPANAVFDCHRLSLVQKRAEVADLFSLQIDTIANSIITMTNNKVPDSDSQFIAVRASSGELLKERDRQLKQFDDAIAQLNESARQAIDQFMA